MMMSPLEEGRAEVLAYFDALLLHIHMGRVAFFSRFTASEKNLLDTIYDLVDSTMKETEDDATNPEP